MNERGRYAATGAEAEFEPGSRKRVLRNLRGIRTVTEMKRVETEALLAAAESAVRKYTVDHRFTAEDVRDLHRSWLAGIYPWAGDYREVNIGKGDFQFAAAREVPRLMSVFERDVLARVTPCRPGPSRRVAAPIAEAHAELVLIHPFREGNGRVARLLAVLMGYQAGLFTLDVEALRRQRSRRYVAAIHAALDRNYEPMTALFEEVIARSSERGAGKGDA